jgi:MATE family multidrug resistance protein
MVSLRKVVVYSLPAILCYTIESMAEIIDTAILGHVNITSVASVAASNSLLINLAWIFGSFVEALSAQVAQKKAVQNKGLRNYFFTTLTLTSVIGLSVAIVLFFLRSGFLGYMMGAKGELLLESKSYYSIRVLGFPLTILSMIFMAIFRGLQRYFLSLCIVLMIVCLNAIGTYICVCHFDLGVEGAAYSTVASFLIADIFSFSFLFRYVKHLNCREPFEIKWEDIKELFKDGIAAIGRNSLLILSFITLLALATRVSISVLASYQIALQVWQFSAFSYYGLGSIGTSLGAFYIGQKNYLAHKVLCKKLTFSLFFIFSKQWVQKIFRNQVYIHELLDTIWLYLVLSQPISGRAYIYEGILFGSRDFTFLRNRNLLVTGWWGCKKQAIVLKSQYG